MPGRHRPRLPKPRPATSDPVPARPPGSDPKAPGAAATTMEPRAGRPCRARGHLQPIRRIRSPPLWGPAAALNPRSPSSRQHTPPLVRSLSLSLGLSLTLSLTPWWPTRGRRWWHSLVRAAVPAPPGSNCCNRSVES
ncbi:hypothetical protein BRADI_1g45872v3 [Brachypodium distachyon]|uniref:Uncharacterized protein n=1 Tax=Brachypodium distachyon TaxID=15368 RepID=A0A2K2DPK5_BRADI|nr:hypothetical protein BRADI_1g45872v3 [Brachypodium distachyon]